MLKIIFQSLSKEKKINYLKQIKSFYICFYWSLAFRKLFSILFHRVYFPYQNILSGVLTGTELWCKCYERNSRSKSVSEGLRVRDESRLCRPLRLEAWSGIVESWHCPCVGKSSKVVSVIVAVIGEKRTLDTEFEELSLAET